jgi:hypothetical protein
LAVNILANVNAARAKVRQKLFQRRDLLVILMSTIINYDINERNLGAKLLPKFPVRLIADMHFDELALVRFAGRLYIHAVNRTRRAEVMSPHSQTPAAVNANFDDRDIAADELC